MEWDPMHKIIPQEELQKNIGAAASGRREGMGKGNDRQPQAEETWKDKAPLKVLLGFQRNSSVSPLFFSTCIYEASLTCAPV